MTIREKAHVSGSVSDGYCMTSVRNNGNNVPEKIWNGKQIQAMT
jgi:hypothetical protein